MAKGQGKKIPDSTRAAVLAALLEGQAVTKIAEDYKLSHTTVCRLKKQLPADKLNEVVHKKELDIATSIAGMLDSSFKAINNILKLTENADWTAKQNASDLATFMGVTADKCFRVLEAIDNAQANAEADKEWPEVVR